MRVGFAKSDITPRVGVELCGFGPFRCRKSIGVRDRLWARAMAMELDGKRMLLVSCDLVGTALHITKRVREIVAREAGLPADALMLCCTHTHSGPCTGPYIGWGEPDPPYIETLPSRIAAACLQALEHLEEAELAHAEVPCEGIGLNREYDKDAQPLDVVLKDDWRPAKPELTDTTCHVLRFDAEGGGTLGFASHFGCHPVVCCEDTHYIHGDYAGVATNLLERENPGSIGLFLQGALGDVNTCIVHQPEQESLLALDVIAGRYARAVGTGLQAAATVEVDRIACVRRKLAFTPKPWDLAHLRKLLAEKESRVFAPALTNTSKPRKPGAEKPEYDVRMETVYLEGLRRIIARVESGGPILPPTELHGIRLGPIALLGTPCEVFQAIKNDLKAAARSPLPLVLSTTNDGVGYAPDRAAAARGGYAADIVPLILSRPPLADAHGELLRGLVALDAALQ